MSDSADLGTADLRALLDLVDAAKSDDPGPAIPWMVLDGLRDLIPCAETGVRAYDVVNRRFEAVQSSVEDEGHSVVGPEAAGSEVPADSSWWTEFPRFNRQWFRDAPPVRRLSARLTREQLRRSQLHQEFWHEHSDLLTLALPAPPGGHRHLVLFRQDHDVFTARDEALLNLLRPHLFEIDRDARRRRGGIPTLTPREWQVLELAAEGAATPR